MENPQSWSRIHWSITQSITDHAKDQEAMVFGRSLTGRIAADLEQRDLTGHTEADLADFLDDFNCDHVRPRAGGWCDDCDRDVVKPIEAILTRAQDRNVPLGVFQSPYDQPLDNPTTKD